MRRYFTYKDDSNLDEFLRPPKKKKKSPYAGKKLKKINLKNEPKEVIIARTPWNPKTHKPFGKKLFKALENLQDEDENEVRRKRNVWPITDEIKYLFGPIRKIYKRK